jgi:hypothetical protein
MLDKLFVCRIFWWFYWSPSSSLGHSSCFFKQVQSPLCSSNCCPHILGMLGIDHSCTCHSFPIGWSPYFSKCYNTCWDKHLFVPNGIMKYPSHVTVGCQLLSPTFWKPNGLVLSLVASFFDGLPTQAKVCFASSKCSFRYHLNMFLFMCGYQGHALNY